MRQGYSPGERLATAANTGSWSWTIPLSQTYYSGNIYRIQILDADNYPSVNADSSNFSIAAPPPAPPALPPIGYWKFDGNGNNEIAGGPAAQIIGNAVFNATGGKFGGYAYIPGSSDALKISHQNVFDLPNSFTIEFWFRQRANQSFRQDLIYKGSHDFYPSGSVNFWIWRQLWDQYNFGPIQAAYVNSNTGYYVGVTNANQLSHGEWHHVAYTKNTAKSEYYLDGVLIYQNSDSAPARTNSAGIVIGDSAVDTDIDNLRIYNYALNSSEILYNLGGGGTGLKDFRGLADVVAAISESLLKIVERLLLILRR